MPSAERTIIIRRPVADVFTFVTNGANATRYRSGVLDVAHVSGQGVGEVWKQGVRGPGGRRIDADYEITAVEPNRRMAFRAIAGPVRPEGEWRFQPTAEGTRLTFALRAEVSGWKKLVMGGAVQSTMDAEMGALDKLKAQLEA